MSKLFFDKIVSLEKLEREVAKIANSPEEKEKLWNLVDELVHHRVLDVVLDKLDHKHHEEFLVKLHHAPHDEHIIEYLEEKIKLDIKEFIRQETLSLAHEILEDIEDKSKSGKKT